MVQFLLVSIAFLTGMTLRYDKYEKTLMDIELNDYQFTQKWFYQYGAADTWARIESIRAARSFLEIGSFEGASVCWMIENSLVEEIMCIDTWEGGHEHKNKNLQMSEIEKRFDRNVKIAIDRVSREVHLIKQKSLSFNALAQMIAQGGKDIFDVIYIDGSHRPRDVISDAVLAFELLTPNGILIFDDYCWTDKTTNDGIRSSPKLAIDAFTTCFFDEISFVNAPVSQIIIKKFKE